MDRDFFFSNGDPSLRAEVQPYLHDGEEILWTGRPCASRPFRPNVILCVFVIFWLGFAVFWTVMASAAGGFFGLFGLPFIAIGCVLVYTTFFGNRKRMAQTVYAVTNKRALILSQTHRGTSCTEYVFSKLQSISMDEVQGTSGTIYFVPDQPYYGGYGSRRYGRRYYNGYDASSSTFEAAFVLIDNVQAVYRLISEQISQDPK